jgi:aspartate aminotransferase
MITLSERIKKVGASPTLAITAKAKKMKAEGIDVVSFGAGEPDFDTPEHIKNAGIESIKKGFTKYTATSGIPELKDAIIEKFKRDNGLTYKQDEIIVSCGAKHTLYNIFQSVCNKGDNVIIPVPFWVSYEEMVKLSDAEPVFVKTEERNNFVPNPKDIEKAVNSKTKIIIINSPSNPTGAVYPESVLKEIADIAVKKDVLLISDEVYEKIIYDGEKHFSPAGFSDDVKKHTITVNAVSKTYSMTGWRIGYAGGPKDIISAMGRLQDHSTSNPVSFVQKASIAALIESQESVSEMLKAFAKRRDFTVNKLKEIKDISFSIPKGAFYVMINISKYLGKRFKNSTEMATAMLDEAKLAIIPCCGFGAPDYLRMSFAISEKDIEKGIDRIKTFLGSL